MNNSSAHNEETSNQETLATTKQTAGELKVSRRTLANWRSIGRPHIRYTRVGRSIRYYRSAIDDYLNKNTVHGEES